ncbi:MAG: SDR family oxidoreductase [Betaproteobacteria bacterium]|nr:SDR family oxidoreductase [Betaproteobacteria bacterium]MBI3057683.1 SDR family oxidoreductase [Betaproteobacteria bacterium]
MMQKDARQRGKLAGRTAIVTGSGQNVGRSIALYFAREGANVVINGHRNKALVDNVVAEIHALGGNALGIMADVGDADAVAAMVRQTIEHFGAVDIAVSNVSIRRLQPFLEISIKDWNDTLNTNLNSCFYMARAVIPGMKARNWGRLIHISGVDGFAGHIPTRAHNIVCKSGMHAFAKAIAVEFGEFGITANTVSPGSLNTTRDWSQYPPNWAEMRKAQIPVKRLGTADEIAAACLYLAGEDAGFVTGQVIHVNGGQYMY